MCGRPCMPSQIMVWAMERAGGRVGNWQRPTCGSGGTRTSPSEPLRPRLLLYKTDRRPQFPFSHLRPVRIYFEFPPPRLLLCLGASLSASPPSPPRRSASRPAVPRRPIRARPIRQVSLDRVRPSISGVSRRVLLATSYTPRFGLRRREFQLGFAPAVVVVVVRFAGYTGDRFVINIAGGFRLLGSFVCALQWNAVRASLSFSS